MKKIAIGLYAWLFPVFAFAQVNNVFGLAALITQIINGIFVPLIFAAAFLMFIWGVVQYFIGGSDDAKRKEGIQKIVYGVVGFAVMVSVWGLVNILLNTFNLNQNTPGLPGVPGPR